MAATPTAPTVDGLGTAGQASATQLFDILYSNNPQMTIDWMPDAEHFMLTGYAHMDDDEVSRIINKGHYERWVPTITRRTPEGSIIIKLNAVKPLASLLGLADIATSPRFASRLPYSGAQCSDESGDDSPDDSDGESYDWFMKNYRVPGSWPSDSPPKRVREATDIKAEGRGNQNTGYRDYQVSLFTRPPSRSKKSESSLCSECFKLKSCTIQFEGLSAKSKKAISGKKSFENYPGYPGYRDPGDINELYTARHREKHREATEHMGKLYDILRTDFFLRSQEAQRAKKELDHIDGQILDMNLGHGLFLGLGQIRRETFISIWRSITTPPGGWPRHFTKTQISDLHSQAKLALREFCAEYDYPSEWACLPPC